MKHGNEPIHRARLRSTITSLGVLVALSAFIVASPAQAEAKRVDVDCREGLTKKLVLRPNEDEVQITISGCLCAWQGQSAADLKALLKDRAAAHMAAAAEGQPAIFPAGGLPIYTYPVAQGEKKDLTFSCYTSEQMSEYYAQAVRALESD
ncbi:MAG: hypothetical protein QF893_05245 [Alphaproteobacteria bacterium]|jgi:hypothetical protein|nr:hypothetical protein [Alphaproteobacteria bacterium]